MSEQIEKTLAHLFPSRPNGGLTVRPAPAGPVLDAKTIRTLSSVLATFVSAVALMRQAGEFLVAKGDSMTAGELRSFARCVKDIGQALAHIEPALDAMWRVAAQEQRFVLAARVALDAIEDEAFAIEVARAGRSR